MTGANKFSRLYVFYVLFLLFLVAVMNVCDRTIVAVLAEDISRDLRLNDREMGLMMGLAFSITYFAAGIPLARLADKRSRRVVVAGALAFWSLMTLLAGVAQNYLQLLLTRMGVGIGEAGGSPPSHSLITDYVDPGFRARALSIIGIGAVVGMGLGTLYGGWAAQAHGWRWTLLSVGLPGLILAALFLATVREPMRRVDSLAPEDELAGASIGRVLSWLFRDRRFVLLACGASLVSMVGLGKAFWEPTFLRRVYDMSAAQAGGWYFLISPLPGILGSYGLSLLTDRLARQNKRWYARIAGLSALVSVPFSIAFYLLPATWRVGEFPVAFLFSIGASLVGGAWMPAISALAQSIAPPSARAVAAASWSMVASLGTGVGPLLVGDLNMRLQAAEGDGAIGYSLAVVAALSLIAFPLFMALSHAIAKRSGHRAGEDAVAST